MLACRRPLHSACREGNPHIELATASVILNDGTSVKAAMKLLKEASLAEKESLPFSFCAQHVRAHLECESVIIEARIRVGA